MSKTIKFNGNLDYSSSTDNYLLRMEKTKEFPWWILLFLMPLLLLVKCNREISVNCYNLDDNMPTSNQNVTLEYSPRFVFNNGDFFPNKVLTQTKTTDSNGYVLFDSLPCSVFSYIFYNRQIITASSSGYCNSESAEERNFHYTDHIDLFLKCPNEIMPPPIEQDTIPEEEAIPEDSLRGQSGNLRFNLQWQSTTDLDLHVIDPCGNEIYYSRKLSTCNGNIGSLDVDANADYPLIPNPQENIYFETPSQGIYKVYVRCYRWRGATSTPLDFNVTIIDKNERKDFNGSVTKGQVKKYFLMTEYIVE